jgi:hypothetical protein
MTRAAASRYTPKLVQAGAVGNGGLLFGGAAHGELGFDGPPPVTKPEVVLVPEAVYEGLGGPLDQHPLGRG